MPDRKTLSEKWAHLRWAPILAAGAGLLLTLKLGTLVYDWEHTRWRQEFEQRAQAWSQDLQAELSHHLSSVEHLSELIRRQPSLTPETFRALAHPFLTGHPALEALAWAPREVGPEATAFTVRVAEPPELEQLLRGFDPGAPGVHRETLQRALESGSTAISRRLISLNARSRGAGFLLVHPTYPLGRSEGPAEGVVLGSYNVPALLRGMLPHRSIGIEVNLFDLADERPLLLHSSSLGGDWRSLFSNAIEPDSLTREEHYSSTVTVGDRRWRLIVTPSPELSNQRAHWLSLLTQLIGGALSLLLASYLALRKRGGELPVSLLAERPARPRLAGESDPARRITELCEENARLRPLIEGSADVIIHTRISDGRINAVSPACMEILGISPEEAVGRSLYDFLHPDDVFRGKLAQLEGTTKPGIYSRTFRARHAAGHYVWLECLSRVVTDPASGEPVETVIVARDSAQRHPELQALRASESLYRSVFDTAPQPIALASACGDRLLRVNQAFCTMLGYSKWELRQLTTADITHPADRGISLASKAAKAGSTAFSFQKRYLRKDGSTVWAVLHAALVREADGSPHYLVCHIHDITAIRSGQADLAGFETY